MTYETIVVDTSADGVATVTLNRPDVLNAFNEAMQREFAAALARGEGGRRHPCRRARRRG